MAAVQPHLAPVARAWPVQLALALIVALVAAMVGVDLVIARRVADRTAEIVENTQRSVELLEDLHSETFLLSRARHAPEADVIAGRLVTIARAYDALANNLGERAEWQALEATLHRLVTDVHAGRESDIGALGTEIDERIDRLIAINREAAHANAEQIRAAHRHAIVADGSVGAVVLALCVAVALVLRQVVSRQRALFHAHITLLDERARELDLFAARAAHDLRAPLSPIRGYADLLATGAESPEEVQQMATRIRRAVDQMARVVDDMLELSRAGRPQPGRSAPRAIVSDVLEELAPELHGAEVDIDLPETVVACAPGVMQQIFRNLIHNAVKFRARDRALRIRVVGHVRSSTDGPGQVELVVEDNGVGMDAETAAHAFQPYYRGRPDREVPGHGLGLAIVDRAVTGLGGRIGLESEPDRGVRVKLTLPRAA